MELIKNALFNLILILGLIAICFTILWWILELFNRIFRFSKIIMNYLQYKRNIDAYDFADKLIILVEVHREKIKISKSGYSRNCCLLW